MSQSHSKHGIFVSAGKLGHFRAEGQMALAMYRGGGGKKCPEPQLPPAIHPSR